MCMHWQANAANKFYEEHKNDTLGQLKVLQVMSVEGLKKAYEEAVKYHGSLERISHGFFSGNIYYQTLICEAVDELLNVYPDVPKTFPLPENTIVIWGKKLSNE